MEYESLIKPPASKFLKSGRVILMPGQEVGEHVTEKREEIIIVLNGKATLTKGNEKIEIPKDETHYIPEGITHNVKNNTENKLEYIYVVSLFS